MAFFSWGIIMSLGLLIFVLVPAIQGCKGDCNCTQSISSLSCKCLSNEFLCAMSQLSNQTTNIDFTVKDENSEIIYLQNAYLGRFRHLTELSIRVPFSDREKGITYLHGLYISNTFQGLNNLKILRVNVFATNAAPSRYVFAPLSSLEELDLSYTQMLGFAHLKETFLHMTTTSLKRLRLRNVQSYANNPRFTMQVNLTDFLEPLERMPLEVLDISRNALMNVIPGVFGQKQLKEVYFHENFIRVSPFYTEILMHPTIEISVGDYQGCPANADYSTQFYHDWVDPIENGIETHRTSSSELPTPPELLETGSKPDLPDQTNGNSARQFGIHPGTLICEFLKIQPLTAQWLDGIACKHFPDVDFKANRSCLLGYEIPFARHLKEYHLAHFSYYQGGFGTLINGTYCFNPQNDLKLVDLSYLGKWGKAYSSNVNEASVSGLQNVEVLNLEWSELELWKTDLFNAFPQLRVLNNRGNRLFLQSDPQAHFFAKNTKLQTLILSNNGLLMVNERQFSHLDQLETLDLSRNQLTRLSFLLPTSGHLKVLQLQGNRIQTVPVKMREELDDIAARSETGIDVDLSENTLSCACIDEDFVRWMQNTKVNFTNPQSYQCQGAPTGGNLIMHVDLQKLDSNCNPSYIAVICASVLSTLGVVAVLAASFALYRKRYTIMHWKYTQFTRPSLEYVQTDTFKYDAFIAYNSDDKWWTHHTLLAEMEDKRKLKLCIYLRDFPAGGTYADVIEEAMNQSNKTVLILSPKFFESSWCLHEMNMVHNTLVAEGLDLMELVVLSPLSSEVMSSTLTQLLRHKSACTLNWTENQDGQKLFWDKLEDAIRSPRHLPGRV